MRPLTTSGFIDCGRRKRVIVSVFLRRFEASLVTETGCREWGGRLDRSGYGRHNDNAAHRVAYTLFVGPIANGLTVDHLCFNTRCVEPSHLRLLTRPMNTRNRSNRPILVPDDECINGHKFDGANTYVTPKGQRGCRTCRHRAVLEYRARRAQERAA